MQQSVTARGVQIRPETQPRTEDRIRAAVRLSRDPAVKGSGYADGAVRTSRVESDRAARRR